MIELFSASFVLLLLIFPLLFIWTAFAFAIVKRIFYVIAVGSLFNENELDIFFSLVLIIVARFSIANVRRRPFCINNCSNRFVAEPFKLVNSIVCAPIIFIYERFVHSIRLIRLLSEFPFTYFVRRVSTLTLHKILLHLFDHSLV